MPWSAATAATAKCKRQFIGFARRRISTTVSPWTCSAIPKRRTELKLLKPSTTSERAKKVPLMMLKTRLKDVNRRLFDKFGHLYYASLAYLGIKALDITSTSLYFHEQNNLNAE